jgi:glycosyl transferase family 25
MHIFLINLARRPDRLAAMRAQLDALGVAFSRVEAVDAAALAPADTSMFAAKGPLGAVAPGDMACTLSHFAAWRALIASGESHGVVLEDDLFVHPAARELLKDAAWIPRDAGLLKIERFGPPSQRVVIGASVALDNGRSIAPLLSKHCGGAGYIISCEIAQRLLDMPGKITLPVDHLLFNPNNSPVFAWLKPWQLLPCLVEQRPDIGSATDIHPTRQKSRPKGLAYFRREAVRGYYELRLVPRLIAALAAGRAKLVRASVG